METAEKTPLQHPQVFLSFRGAEVRQCFVSYLETALRRDGVNVCVDQVLMRGEPMKSLFMGIEESMIALVIFSKRYTESFWCLEELFKIKERAEVGKLMVIPIYYKLNPSDVRGLDGDFGINLWNQVKRTSEFDKLSKWKEALDFVSAKPGLTLAEYSDERTFVANVVYHVKNGMDRLLRDVKSDVIPMEADIVQTEVKFPGKLRKDDGLNLIKDDEILGEANSDATSKLQDSAEINKVDPFSEEKQGNVSESSTMATYDKYPPQHQVFINFRGAELRHGFISHLMDALKRNGVNAYVETNELKGSPLTILFNRIEESNIALVVFSRRYAESRWCLNELLKIKELMDEGKLLVIPIFYKVEPSHVTNLKEEFGDNFWTLWRINRDNHIIKWKEALKSVASMEGIYLEEDGSESEVITLIVKEVLESISQREGENPSLFPSKERRKTTEFPTGEKENNETYLNLNKCHLFGMEQRMEQLEKKLEFDCKETRIIGVTGMHGIGKTTLAMMLHEKWNCKFIRCVPLLGIRKKSEEYGPQWLRKTLLEILLEGKSPVISDETTHGSLKVELLKTKIFAVLDDVSDKEQLEFLLGDLDWIKKGSKIVITMCDKSLLGGLSHDTYVVPELNNRDAFQLFSYHAFYDQISSPTGTFLTLSRMFVDYARGHPLALKLLGRELRGKDNAYWKYILERVPKKSNMMFQDVWRFSTDQLNEKQKDVFLDIVCFFKSEDEYVVRSLLDSGDPDSTDAVSEVKDLVNKFLITIDDGRVEMNVPFYSLSEDRGSSRWLRMCNYKDIINELEKIGNSEEANNVRGIFLNMSKLTKSIILDSFTFINMRNLRYLKIYNSSCHGDCKVDCCNLYLPEGIKFPLKEVRYIHWVKFPLEELPPDFRPENLVDLGLPYSKIERVWKGVKDAPQLKWVDLSHSSKLFDLSALSKAENLQRLNLEGCTSLVRLPVEIQRMISLSFLNLRGCIRLLSLPKMNLISLKTLILSGCTNLKEFQLISVSLEVLHLDGTALKELPPAIKKLQRLVILNLKNCKMLKSLPNCLGELKALEELILSGCSSLKNLSDVRESMKHLQSLLIDRIGAKEMPNISFVTLRRLCLSGNDFVSLQADIGKLYYLNWLDVKQCKMLTSIPMLPPKLQYFDAHGCDSLQRVANPLALPVLSEKIHATFSFSNCNKLDQDAKDSIIYYTRWKNQLVVDAVSRYNRGSISEDFTGTCFPGWKVPALFSHQASGSMLKTKLPPHWCDNRFTGIGLCAVILFPAYHEQMNHVLVKCICEFKNEDESSIRFSCTVGGWREPSNTPRKIESSHVVIGFTSRLDIKEHSEEEDEEGCSHIEASFEFQVTDGTKVLEGCKVLKCGFSLVYAADEREDISRASNTVVIPERIENILGYERSSGNSASPDDILDESYSGLIMGREEKFFSEGKSDASPSMLKNFENKRVDLLNEESNAGEEVIFLEKLNMHSLVGVEMSKDLGSPRRHRLWNSKDIIDRLTTMEQLEANNLRGIFLDMSHITKSIALECTTFTDMHNLLYLKIYDSSSLGQCKVDCNLCFPDGLEFPLKEIRYLHWVKYPLWKLPSDFRPNNLVELRLPYSKIERVWEGVKVTPQLKWVDLSHSSKLLDLSALSKAENLQRLNLEGCTSLDELPVEIQNMKSLDFLNLRGCIRLPSFPKINLISLKTLILSDCSNLKDFQLYSESVEFLHLDGTAIKELPLALLKFKRLVVLNLKNCKMLESLPNGLGKLTALDELILSGCSRLKNLPDVWNSLNHLQVLLLDGTGATEMPSISCVPGFKRPNSLDMFLQPLGLYSNVKEWLRGSYGVSSLQRLCLSGNDFVSLQPDIAKFCNLKWLDVKQCKKLKFVPMLPPRLQYFDAHGCESLERVANPLALPVLSEQIHATFNFSNCNMLDQDAKDNIMFYTRWRGQLVLDELTRYCGGFAMEALIGTCFPGWEVPAWFSHRASGSVLEPKFLTNWRVDRFSGIALCAVIVFHGYDERKHVLVKCNCELKNEDGSSIQFSCTVGGWSKPSNASQTIESTHVFIGYTSNLNFNKHGEEDDKEGCGHTEASFEFQVTDGMEVLEGCEVLKCGFSFLYTTDELQVEPGVRGAPVEGNYYRAYSKNGVMSNARGDTETAERSRDGGCEIVQLPNKMIAHEIATTPQPPTTESPVPPPEYGTGSNNLGRHRLVGAVNLETQFTREPQHLKTDISVVASSSQTGHLQSLYRVLISFHGARIRMRSFVSNLVSSLTNAGVNVFADNDNGIGLKLEDLYKRKEELKIALVIFSKRYLESICCLNELMMIDKLAKEGKLLVIPIFYDVRSSDVKNLEGEFGKRFKEMRARYKDEPEKLLKWETSVKSIAKTTGIESEVYGKYDRLVEATVKAVQIELSKVSGRNQNSMQIGNITLGQLSFESFLIFVALSFTGANFIPTNMWLVGWLAFIVVRVVVSNLNTRTDNPLPPDYNHTMPGVDIEGHVPP